MEIHERMVRGEKGVPLSYVKKNMKLHARVGEFTTFPLHGM